MGKANTHTADVSLNYNGVVYGDKEALKQLAENLMNSASEEEVQLAMFLIQWCNDSLYIQLQTSGSTGLPKQITVAKKAMLASAERTIHFFNLKPEDTALLCLSTKYIAGKMMVVRAMLGRLHLVMSRVNSNPLAGINSQIDFAAMVPLQVATILAEDITLFNNVKTLIVGGGKMDSTLASELKKTDVQVWETYGMTETVSHIALRKVNQAIEPFKVLPKINISVDDRGCLVIHPSSVNHNQLVTNDVVELLSQNEFILKGRYDHVINTGGIKVFPEEVERKLEPHIKQPFVVSYLNDHKLGQRIVLVLQGEENNANKWQYVFEKLQPFERPKEVRFLAEFPMTETGKVQRLKLHELL